MKKSLFKIIISLFVTILFFIAGTIVIKNWLNMPTYTHAFEMFCIGFLVSSVVTIPYIGIFILLTIELFKSNDWLS